jgi:UPF0271 protein
VTEAFADRAYADDGTLVRRGQPGAVLTDKATVAERTVALVTGHGIDSINGTRLRLAARSVCVHGDTPGAVGLATAVRAALEQAGVALVPFA